MKTYLDCIPCFFKQGLNAGRLAGLSAGKQKKILDSIAAIVKDISLNSSPPEIAVSVYGAIRESSGMHDPFKKIKEEYTDFALELYPQLKTIVKESENKILTAVRISIAGNIIDFGTVSEFNVEETLQETLTKEFAESDYKKFKNRLEVSENILFIGDNAGETVFDRVLIEEINSRVIFAVREEPVINDALYSDAKRAGIDRSAKIISSGSDAPGTILERCNHEFRDTFMNADMVISKGQGNYETLSDCGREIFFLLKVKCPVIAEDTGVPDGSIILLKGGNN